MRFAAHVAEPDGTTTAFGLMLPPETAWVDVERVGDLDFVVRAVGRNATVGLRLGSDEPGSNDGGTTAKRGSIAVRFATAPGTATPSREPVGHQLHVSWPDNEVFIRLSL